MRKWIVTVKTPWHDAEDPWMTDIIEAASRGKAIAAYIRNANDAGYHLRFTDAQAKVVR